MFADELKSNASKKRAEANRAKRRQMKQKEAAKRTAATTTTATATALGVATSNPAIANNAAPAGLFGVPISTSTPIQATTTTALTVPAVVAQHSSQLTAVEKAKIEREKRALDACRRKSAILIQSFYRCWRSNQALQKEILDTLRARVSDVESLAKILEEKKGISFVPPPATTTALTQQLLWLAKTIPYGNRPSEIRHVTHEIADVTNGLLQGCIIPSVSATDEDSNPFINWMESTHGKQRFNYLLRLMACLLLDKQSSTACVQSIARLVELILAPSTTSSNTEPSSRRKTFLAHARTTLLCTGSDPIAPGTKEERSKCRTPFHRLGTSLDLLCVVRYYLMFACGGPDPIPETASDLREKAIPDAGRRRGGTLFIMLWNVLEANPKETARAFAFIWTVPLLSWKLSGDALSLLVEPDSSERKPPLEKMILAFIEDYTNSTTPGSIDSFLPSTDVNLTMCAATSAQCMLANLAQIGRLCKAVNGSDIKSIDFGFSVVYYDFLAVLLDTVPLTTVHSRESAVEWISDGKGHHTPVVISSAVLDQCKALTVDSFMRRIFQCAIDVEYFQTDKILAEKNDKDLELEKDLVEASGSSNAALAAQEARIDRSKPFWASSKWAGRLKKNVTNFLSGEGRDKQKGEPYGSGLVDNSKVSAKLAKGEVKASDPSAINAVSRRSDFRPSLLFSLCRVYSVILARWGGGGGRDITDGSQNISLKGRAVTKPEVVSMSILNALSFSTPILRVAWGLIQSDKKIKTSIAKLVDADFGGGAIRARHCLSCLRDTIDTKENRGRDEDAMALLLLFVSCLCHTLIVTDDVEIHDFGKPLPLHQLRRVILLLKQLLFKVCCTDESKSTPCHVGCATISVAARAMSDLYNRSSRRALCLPKVWLVPDLLERELRNSKTHEDYVSLLSGTVLRVCPQLVSFKRRLKLFERIVHTNKVNVQGENSPNPFHPNPLKPARVAIIHRGRILEDGLATMNNLGANMRQRISVHYVSETGHKETGVDAGGLFKDFWTDLCAIAFDPNYALFAVTEGAGNCLFPSPLSYSAHGTDHLMLFAFLGRILGKALYEGITIQPRFAHFFLSFMKGRYNYLNMLADLSTIDPDLYKNLLFLKTYDGNASDLCLAFTITNNDFGGSKEYPLIPNGGNIEVTNENKARYIELVAKHYVVDRVREQSEAFTRGLWEVIDPLWLRLFNEPELQVLISGATGGEIDVEDLKRHTRYVGGYTGLDRTIGRFWKVVATLDSNQQAKLLRFVTSCERPPPLGFASLNPPFTIQRVGILRDSDKLPSSSTCFNILKLPTYSSEQVLRKKLLYALDSGSGFELT